jgi:hypothetical protein
MLWGEEVSTGQNRARAGKQHDEILAGKVAKSSIGQATRKWLSLPIRTSVDELPLEGLCWVSTFRTSRRLWEIVDGWEIFCHSFFTILVTWRR